MVNGKEVSSVSVLNKVLKSSANKFTFRVERKMKNILLNDDKVRFYSFISNGTSLFIEKIKIENKCNVYLYIFFSCKTVTSQF